MAIDLDKCFPQLRDFCYYMETIKGATTLTVEGYYIDLMLFFKYMKYLKSPKTLSLKIEEISVKDIDIDFIEDIQHEDIMQFFHYLKITRGNSDRTRARKATSLKMFFKYLHVIMEVLESNPTEKIEFPRQKKDLPKFMQMNECVQLLNSIDGPNKERDYCLIVIFLNCGVRLSELVGMNLKDIQKDGRIIVRGKGRKERMLYFNEACQEAVKEYQTYKEVYFKNKSYDHNALFIGTTGKRLSKRWVEEIVKRRIDQAGFSGRGLSPHKLRHTAATIMYQNGNDIRLLKDILGHEDLGTTQIYTHISNDQMKKAMCESPITRKKDTDKNSNPSD